MAPYPDPSGGPDLSDFPRANASGFGVSTYGQGPAMEDIMGFPLYMGQKEVHEFDPRMAKVEQQLGNADYDGYTTHVPRRMTIGNLMASFDAFSHKQFIKWRDRLAAAGYSVGSGTPLETRDAFLAMLTDVADRQTNMGRPHLTPAKYLDELIRMGGGMPGSGKKRSKTTSIVKDIYSLDPAEARTILTRALQQELGRDPTADEVRDFTDAVNMSAEDDPSIKKTTTQYVKRPDGSLKRVVSSSSVDSGYTSDDALWEAMDEAKQSPEYDDYQAVSEYFPVIESLLNSAV